MNKKDLKYIKGIGVVLLLIIFVVSCKKDGGNGMVTPPSDTYKSPVTVPATPVSYALVWADEFNGTAVDPANWNIDTGSPGVNNEKEYYQSANTAVVNGNLVITAKKETVGGMPYTSAKLNTMGKITVKYGRIEARIKLPQGAGLWPAFWMLGSDITTVSWPNCGELDIMEHVNADNLVYGTMHWNSGAGHAQYGLNTTTTPDDYHLYAIEWDANSVKWYVDSTLFVTGNIQNNINNTGAFQLPFFIILNLAVAGDFPGQVVDENKLPASMYVDYVRVFKAK